MLFYLPVSLPANIQIVGLSLHTYAIQIVQDIHDDDGRQQSQIDPSHKLLLTLHPLFGTQDSHQLGRLQPSLRPVDMVWVFFHFIEVFNDLLGTCIVLVGDAVAGGRTSCHLGGVKGSVEEQIDIGRLPR